MRRLLSLGLFISLSTLLVVSGFSRTLTAQQRRGGAAPAAPSAADTLAKSVAAANAFLSTLDAAQRAKAAFPFDSPQKTNWSNLPSGIFTRNSLKIGDMTAPQRDALMALLQVVLSKKIGRAHV